MPFDTPADMEFSDEKIVMEALEKEAKRAGLMIFAVRAAEVREFGMYALGVCVGWYLARRL